MRPKILIAFFAVAAFFCAFFGATAVARAAQADEGDVMVATANGAAAASPAAHHANVAAPGTYAAAFGAPLCDDRGASAYAVEPRPAAVDGGEVAAGATEECQTSVGALFKAATDASPAQQDDLARTPPVAQDLAILPAPLALPAFVQLVAELEGNVEDGARDGYAPHDNPPPRPIPWRS
jgi:hypothetical protein